MKKTIGYINMSIQCKCPYCKESMYTDIQEEFEQQFREEELELHHDSFEYMVGMVILCIECKKEFILENVEYNW